MELITSYVGQHGYIILFLCLMLELFALPFPGEVLMSYSGFLASQGRLNLFASILIASMGISTGMTVTYWLGFKLGRPFFERYGHHLLVSPERLEKTSRWFGKYGNKIVIVTYFIPGIRHITGYFSGITKISFRAYALYAYTGAIIWAGTFISLGKMLGPHWEQFYSSLQKYLIIGILIIAVILILIYLCKIKRQQNSAITSTEIYRRLL